MGETANETLVGAVAEALESARPSPDDLALVIGSVDRRIAAPLAPTRVVMNGAVTGLSLPRESLAIALSVLGPLQTSMSVDALVTVRNALARDAALVIVGPRGPVAAIADVAQLAGFSRRSTRDLAGGYRALELKR
jgi:hypothetical protein